jgi:hypothetical protein
MDQIIESENITINDVKERYNQFTIRSKAQSDEIADVIDVKEMEDIRDLIIQFNDRLNGVVEAQPQTTAEKTTGKVMGRLAMIPILGKFLEGEAEDAKIKEQASKTTREILQEMFDVFREKSDVLELSFERAFKLRDVLLEKEKELEIFSTQIKNIVLTTDQPLEKVGAIKLGGLVESNKLKNKEKIYNKLDFILQFIEEQLTTISLMMPGIETGLVEDSEIGSFLTSVSNMNQIFKSLTELSNSVARSGNEKVMKLITEVNDSMTNTVDVDHMEKLASTNKAFMKQMISGTEKKLKRDAQTYGKLMNIGSGLDQNVIAYNESSKQVLLDTRSYMGGLEDTIEGHIITEPESPVVDESEDLVKSE